MAIHTEWKCPACGALLAMEDVNMAADMVLCRSCNKISKFSEIVQEERDEEILDSIPRRMSVTKTARGLEITYKKPKGAGLFLLMFSIFWNSVICVALFEVMREMSCENLFELLFLIPFVLVGAGTFTGAFLCVVWPHDADPDTRQGGIVPRSGEPGPPTAVFAGEGFLYFH